MKINTAPFFRFVGSCQIFIPSQFLALSASWHLKRYSVILLDEALWIHWSWHSQLFIPTEHRVIYSTVKKSQRELRTPTTVLPRPLQRSGRKVMFSVRQAVKGNNKNNLKWWLVHYSLSSGIGSPLFPLFPVCLQSHFRKYALLDSKCWVCIAKFVMFLLSYLFWAVFIQKFKTRIKYIICWHDWHI